MGFFFFSVKDNTKHGFLQLDNWVSVYQGTESADLAMLNRELDVWQHIKIPADYISTNWPIESSCILDNTKLLAIAGRHGFSHFNAVSGRWKLFKNKDDKQAIRAKAACSGFATSWSQPSRRPDPIWYVFFSYKEPGC